MQNLENIILSDGQSNPITDTRIVQPSNIIFTQSAIQCEEPCPPEDDCNLASICDLSTGTCSSTQKQDGIQCNYLPRPSTNDDTVIERTGSCNNGICSSDQGCEIGYADASDGTPCSILDPVCSSTEFLIGSEQDGYTCSSCINGTPNIINGVPLSCNCSSGWNTDHTGACNIPFCTDSSCANNEVCSTTDTTYICTNKCNVDPPPQCPVTSNSCKVPSTCNPTIGECSQETNKAEGTVCNIIIDGQQTEGTCNSIGNCEVVQLTNPFSEETQIMDNSQGLKLQRWLTDKGLDSPTGWERCYDTFNHNKDVLEWHRLCDEYEPTIVVASNTSGYIFGGYTGHNWGETQHWLGQVKDYHDQFLFRLDSPIPDVLNGYCEAPIGRQLPISGDCLDGSINSNGERCTNGYVDETTCNNLGICS